MKEVKKEPQKENFNLTILNLLSQGINPKDISKQLNISMPNLSYYLRNLKKSGNIKKVAYGTWEVKTMTLNTLTKKDKQIRGHAFIWTIKLNKKFDWIKLLDSTGPHNYKLVRGLIPRIVVNNHKVWLGKSTITIYESKSFYADNSIQSRKFAVITLLEVLEALESLLKINLRPYIFKPTREHYSMIKNDLARQYNRNNEKMIIHDDLEGDWLWIDDSESLNELETKNIVRSKQVQDWWNDNKKHDFKVTPSFLLENLNKVIEVQNNDRELTKGLPIAIKQLEAQISSHLKLIQEYRHENISWRKSESKKIKTELTEGKQKSIFDY
jgi:hypothetical protein